MPNKEEGNYTSELQEQIMFPCASKFSGDVARVGEALLTSCRSTASERRAKFEGDGLHNLGTLLESKGSRRFKKDPKQRLDTRFFEDDVLKSCGR